MEPSPLLFTPDRRFQTPTGCGIRGFGRSSDPNRSQQSRPRICRFSPKANHLHLEEQLFSMAGSFGYVVPKVLGRKGHGKRVDVRSTVYVLIWLFANAEIYRVLSAITYVLLRGYTPFTSEDLKELARETMAIENEFHDRYWKSVSQEDATTLAQPSLLLICWPQNI